MQQYEIAVLYHPDLEIDLDKATEKVEKILQKDGGKITNTDQWGKRKLAYSINDQENAIYVFYTVELNPSAPSRIDEELRIADEVIRYLITKLDLKTIAKAEAAKAKKAKRTANKSRENDTDDEENDE